MARNTVNGNPQINQLAQETLVGVLHDLRVLFPLEDERKLLAVVKGVVGDQFTNMPKILDAYVNKPEFTRWQLRLERASLLVGGAPDEVRFVAPKRIETCKTVEEALKTATILALIHSPTARAVLAHQGLRTGFTFIRDAASEQEPKA